MLLPGDVPLGSVVGAERVSGVGEDRDVLVQGPLLMVEHEEELRQHGHRGLRPWTGQVSVAASWRLAGTSR